MKNVNTTVWYVAKAIIFDVFKIIKAHIVDDDCNEYIATIKGEWLGRGYHGFEALNIIDLEAYDKNTWYDMENDIDYVRAKRIA